MPFPSSTVMTPSLPTFSITSAMMSPISWSWPEIVATWEICSLPATGLGGAPSAATTASTPASMPRLRFIGLAPAATLRIPSRTIAWARTVAVVVPSPATSLVLVATSRASRAPMVSNGSLRSISLATLTPSSTTAGGPNFFSSTTLRPRGPSGTRAASGRAWAPPSGAGVRGEEAAVANIDVHGDALPVVIEPAGADGEHLAHLGLLAGGIGNDETGGADLLLPDLLHEDAVAPGA